MVALSDSVRDFMVGEARSLRSNDCVGVLFCYALRINQDEHKRLLRLALEADLDAEARKQSYEEAWAIPYDTDTFAFSVAGWGLDELKESKFCRIEIKEDRIYVPPDLQSFLDGRQLSIAPGSHGLVLKEPASRDEILEVLARESGPFLSKELINA